MPQPPGSRIRPLDWGFERPHAGPPRTVPSLVMGRLEVPEPPPVLSQLGHGTGLDEVCCGPTCLVMAGVAWGIVPRSASVRAAIMAASRWGSTGRAGTTVQGLGKIADGMGIDFEQRPHVTPAGVRDFLRIGAHVVVRGNSHALPWANPDDLPDDGASDDDAFSGHVVFVVGEDDEGRFVVHDPYLTDGEPRTMSDAELERFGAARDYRDRPFIMGVAKLAGGAACRRWLIGEEP